MAATGGAQRAEVGLGVALVLAAQRIRERHVFDEPAGGVNLTMLAILRERLLELNRTTGATFVVIEHNMDFVMSLCTRLIVLAEGKILAEGDPETVRRDQRVIEAYLGN